MKNQKVDIERVRLLNAELAEINKASLDKIDFYEGGVLIKINNKIIKDFKFTGLANVDFIMTDFYKHGFDDIRNKKDLTPIIDPISKKKSKYLFKHKDHPGKVISIG